MATTERRGGVRADARDAARQTTHGTIYAGMSLCALIQTHTKTHNHIHILAHILMHIHIPVGEQGSDQH